jgi:hypothetical protein
LSTFIRIIKRKKKVDAKDYIEYINGKSDPGRKPVESQCLLFVQFQ